MYLRLTWGKKFVQGIMSTGYFLPEQGGNKLGALGTSSLLLKVLSFDHIRILRVLATVFNNDASACYDRILPTITTVLPLPWPFQRSSNFSPAIFISRPVPHQNQVWYQPQILQQHHEPYLRSSPRQRLSTINLASSEHRSH